MTGDDPFGLTGQVIEAQYRVDEPIGEGGFSVVYKGLHLGLNEPVAIKCLKLQAQPALDSTMIESFLNRFRDESRILYRLSQGNLDIVRAISSGSTVSPVLNAFIPYMVLEWLEGNSLGYDLRERRGQGLQGRTLEETLDLFEPAAQAIAYAHSQGVVHRDVKPGNLFLTQTREGVRLKVLDFGLAKIVGESIGFEPSAQTIGFVTVCSPSYGAPEQFDGGAGPIGPWTDVYSLAILLLEVLRDKKVRRGEGLAQCAVEALDPHAQLTCHALGIKVRPPVEVTLARAVAYDTKMRHANVGEFWEQLRAAARRPSSVPVRAQTLALDNAATIYDPNTAPQLAQTAVASAGRGAAMGAKGGTLHMDDIRMLAPVGTQPLPPPMIGAGQTAPMNPVGGYGVPPQSPYGKPPTVPPQPMAHPIASPGAYPPPPYGGAWQNPSIGTGMPAIPMKKSRAGPVLLALLLLAALAAGGWLGYRLVLQRGAVPSMHSTGITSSAEVCG